MGGSACGHENDTHMEKMKTTSSMLPTTGCELCTSTVQARQALRIANAMRNRQTKMFCARSCRTL